MSTTWELLQQSLADAARAEGLVRDGAFLRELRRDPERALGAFSLRHQEPQRHAEAARAPLARRRVLSEPVTS